MKHLVFTLFIVSILALCGCTADSTGGQPSDETPSAVKDIGFIISFGDDFSRAYYTSADASYYKIKISLGSTEVAEEKANTSETVKITLAEEGLYTIAVTAHNSTDKEIASGSTQKQLYYDSGYQEVSIVLIPYNKSTIDVTINVTWGDPNSNPNPTSNMVFVEGGTFQMGSNDEEAYDREKPVHEVTVNSFYMSKYEVTQAEYEKIMGNNPSYFKGDKLPVECVTWYNAVKYCNKRSVAEGIIPCYTIDWIDDWRANVTCNWNANGYRLPTEAEWEYAAREGIHKSTFKYSGSDNIDEVAWYNDNSCALGSSHLDYGTHEVGTKKANALGIYDMTGNVFEWCWDWFGNYSDNAENNPLGPASGSDRIYRGGSWTNGASYCWCVSRYYNEPNYHYSPIGSEDNGLGFRVVRSCK